MVETSYFRIREQGDLFIIDLLSESLSGVNIQEDLGDPLVAFVSEKHPQKVLANFSTVKLVSSDAIGAFIRLRKELKDRGGEMKLYGMDPNVRLSFKLLNLDGTMFDIFESELQASEGFS